MNANLAIDGRKSEVATLKLEALVPWVIFFYALSYDPFISSSFILPFVRYGIEFFTIYLVFIVTFQYPFTKWIFLLPIALMIFGSIVISGTDTILKVVASLNKIIFFALTIGLLCRKRKILNTCIKIWVNLFCFLCVMAILGSLGYATGVIHFPPLEFGEINPGAQYRYLSNLIFGNLESKLIFDIQFARVAGYMYEPGMLAFFCGFNIMIARLLVNKKQLKTFIWVNFTAGCLTLSWTFYFFFVSFFIVRFGIGVNKLRGIRVIASLFLLTLLIYYFISIDILGYSSYNDRINRLAVAVDIIQDNTWVTTLFGNGIGVSLERGEIGGVSSAPANIFIERGAIMLVFLYYLLVKCSKYNRWLMLYLIYYSLLFEMFWWPLYLIAMAIAYAVSYAHLPAYLKVVIKDMPLSNVLGQRIILQKE